MIRIATLLALLGFISNAAEKLDINRLYTLPWIIGTAPQDFAWSARGIGGLAVAKNLLAAAPIFRTSPFFRNGRSS